MHAAPLTPDEDERVRTLHRLELLDSDPEEAFDALTRLAAEMLDVPIALVSLVDTSRQWFKSRVGLAARETDRNLAFCAHAIHGCKTFVVNDASMDERFHDNPLVLEGPRIRAYAGVPLTSLEGQALGTLCAIDQRPREFTPRELRFLQELALIAQREIHNRETAMRAKQLAESSLRQLRDREALFKAIFEGAALGIALVTRDGRWQMVNPRLCAILGRKAEELMSMGFRDITHPADLAGDVEIREKLLSGEIQRGTREKRYLTAEGAVIWANVEASLIRDASGQPDSLVLVIKDITARRETEMALKELQLQLERRVEERTRELNQTNRVLAESVRRRELSETALAASEQELRAVLANAQDAYVAMGDDGLVREWNQQAELTFGWTREEAIGQNLAVLIVPDAHQDKRHTGLRRWAITAEPHFLNGRMELTVRRKDGREIPCELSVTRLPDAGRRVLYVAFLHDISERRESQLRLSASEARLNAVVNDQSELICRFNASGRITFANRACQEFFGLAEGTLTSADWKGIVHPEDLPAVMRAIATQNLSNPVVVTEHRVICPDGQVRWAEFVNRRFYGAAGELLEVQTVGRDVTDRKLLELQLADLTSKLSDLYENAPCGYHSLGPDGRFLSINAVALSWLGCTAADVIGKATPWEFFAGESVARCEEMFERFKLQGETGAMEFDLHSRDGTVRRVSVRATAVTDDGGRFLMSRTVMFDISELHRTRQALEALSRQQHLMLDNDLVGIVKTKGRRTIWHNRAFGRTFGYADGELIGQPSRVIYADDETHERVGREAYPLLDSGGTYRAQLPMLHSSGKLIWTDVSGGMLSPESGESLWMMLDVTQMKAQQEHAEALAFHDPLTGLPNRYLLQDRMAQAIANAARVNRCLAVCFLDLNGFKAVNDAFGHEAGDELLRAAAMRLLSCVRTHDTAARLGGDEFVLLLTQLNSPEEAQQVLSRACDALAEPVALPDGRTAQVTASVGVAFYPLEAEDGTSLLALADKAMYEAKRAHKATIQGCKSIASKVDP